MDSPDYRKSKPHIPQEGLRWYQSGSKFRHGVGVAVVLAVLGWLAISAIVGVVQNWSTWTSTPAQEGPSTSYPAPDQQTQDRYDQLSKNLEQEEQQQQIENQLEQQTKDYIRKCSGTFKDFSCLAGNP